ncbi:MAG: hypothetical protein JO046_04480 [Solirubrobacterales bacterium]|nr:hypothetical protein [Solirubrobacterales bacterium]
MVSSVPWQEERMHIYDSTVRVPQLLARYAQGEALPHPVLDEARSALNAHDIGALGEPFVSADAALSPEIPTNLATASARRSSLLVLGFAVLTLLTGRRSVSTRPQRMLSPDRRWPVQLLRRRVRRPARPVGVHKAQKLLQRDDIGDISASTALMSQMRWRGGRFSAFCTVCCAHRHL